MYAYLSILIVLAIALTIKRLTAPSPPNEEDEIDIIDCIKKVEPYSQCNPELYKEYVNNLELFQTTKVIDYLKSAVQNVDTMTLYVHAENDDDDFEELNLENVSNTLKKYIDD